MIVYSKLLCVFQFQFYHSLIFPEMVCKGWAQEWARMHKAMTYAPSLFCVIRHPFRRRRVVFARAEFNITMLSQRLFILCFLWFPIRSAYITNPRIFQRGSSDTLGGIIARNNAHPLRSTVPGAVPGYLGISAD